MSEPKTSVQIFAGDLERLKRHQRRISDRADQWLTMPEIIRGLINAAEAKTETGELWAC
jgi:hypothetical protein